MIQYQFKDCEMSDAEETLDEEAAKFCTPNWQNFLVVICTSVRYSCEGEFLKPSKADVAKVHANVDKNATVTSLLLSSVGHFLALAVVGCRSKRRVQWPKSKRKCWRAATRASNAKRKMKQQNKLKKNKLKFVCFSFFVLSLKQ